MDVSYDIFPEDVYFDKVTAALSSAVDRVRRLHDRRLHDLDLRSGRLDRRPQRVHQGSGEDEPELQLGGRACPGLRASTAWNGVPGGELGSADAKQWCVPWGYELNNIAYNRRMFDKVGVQPPKNLEDLVDVSAKLTKDAGGPMASAFAARGPGRRSIRASSPAIRTSASATSLSLTAS